MLVERLGLEDADFWGDPWRTRKAVQRKLMEAKQEAFLIDAPEKVALDAHGSIPLAILRVAPLGVESHFARSAVITAMSLYTGDLSAALAFDPPATLAGAGGGGGGDAMLGEAHLIDLARRMGLPMARGDYLVGLVVMDKLTPRRRVRVVESSAYEDPAVEVFIRNQLAARLEKPRVSPVPGSDPRSILPVYEAMDESPPFPAESGVELAMERVNLLPASECVVFGSYRLPVEPRHALAASPQGPTAILPITLLFTGSVDAAPKLARLFVPCHRPLQQVDGQAIATGHFAIDASKLVRIGMTPQTYFVYAFAGSTVSGPFPTAFVHIPLVPQRTGLPR